MNRMALALGLVAAMSGLTACKSEDPMTITLPDAAPNDAGMTNVTPDTGTQDPPDAGPESCSVTLTTSDVPPLSGACLPRCSAATAQAVGGCTTAECQQAALAADTTPSIPFVVNGMNDGPLDCATCFGYHQMSCAHDVCPTETTAIMTCNPMTDAMACMPQQMALQTCIGANETAFQDCYSELAPLCFGVI